MNFKLNICFLFALLLLKGPGVYAQKNKALSADKDILVEFNHKGISRISSPQDPYNANLVRSGNEWGMSGVLYRIGEGDWLNLYTGETRMERLGDKIIYTDFIEGMPLKMERSFQKDSTGLEWKIRIKNMSKFPITIGDLNIPFPWASPGGADPNRNFEKSFTKHHHIAGNASFLYFTRPSGEPPYLMVMTNHGTRLEYFDEDGDFKVFIHSALSAEREQRGTWRLENTTYELNPNGQPQNAVEYGFRVEWADSYDEMRDILYENGLFDTRVVPGMSLPQDLTARFSLRSKNKIDSIIPEFPNQTKLTMVEEDKKGHQIYEVDFDRLGENLLTIHYNGGEKTILEFFSTEPVRTLITKRSKFLTEKQQHKDPEKWYDGLYSVWDMENEVLRGPDNTDGFDHWWGYVLASDDPALSKAPFLAAKNVYMPDDEEIESLEYYMENFVWGGLQRTDEESPYPYGIYGTPNWKVNRDEFLRAGVKDRNLDKMNIWRSYDYPHILMMYYHMFEIAEFYPEKTNYLDADGYLERAFQTAKAFFTYPYEILPWYDTYKWGLYNELVILPLIETLEEDGRIEDADWLRNEWEKKVKYFVYDDTYPFRSEYSFDRTAFESTYAFAKYGTLTEMEPDENLWYDVKLEKWYSHPEVKQEDSREFMDRQLRAGLAVRGWLEPSYYTLGSDFSLSYMARMGGWGILDYGLEFAEEPWDWLQLGYASYLSSFALMNTGTPESNYGYWFPGKENDGATGWAFNRQKYGEIWLQDRSNPRGAWTYDGEADLGNGAIFRTAATIVAEDPLFGWTAYGGQLRMEGDKLFVIPKDGVGIKFALVTEDSRITAKLNRDRYSLTDPVETDKEGRSILFRIDNITGKKHNTELKFTGTKGDKYAMEINGQPVPAVELNGATEVVTSFAMPPGGSEIKLTKMY